MWSNAHVLPIICRHVERIRYANLKLELPYIIRNRQPRIYGPCNADVIVRMYVCVLAEYYVLSQRVYRQLDYNCFKHK